MDKKIKVEVEHDIGCGLIVAIGLLIGILIWANGNLIININSNIETPAKTANK